MPNSKEPRLEGWLEKEKQSKTSFFGSTRSRYFKVEQIGTVNRSPALCYYYSPSSSDPSGWFFLKDVTALTGNSGTSSFRLSHPARNFSLSAKSQAEYLSWIGGLSPLVPQAVVTLDGVVQERAPLPTSPRDPSPARTSSSEEQTSGDGGVEPSKEELDDIARADKKTLLEVYRKGSRTRGLTLDKLIKKGWVVRTNGRVKVLYLHSNQLTILPEAIGALSSLKELHLSDNQLTALPAALGELTRLTVLSLSKNQLTTLPAAIGEELTSLTHLYLGNNQLTALPPAIGKLTNLTVLYLYNNPIASGLEHLRHLTKLSNLYITPPDLLVYSQNLPGSLRYKPFQDQLYFLRERYSRTSRRYCVLTCLSRLTANFNAGEEYAAADEEGDCEGGGGGQGDGGGLQGVLAFDVIASADVWRYILEFV